MSVDIIAKQKVKYNRYLKERKRLKPLTICIASTCELDQSPRIVFCADRLVSAKTQFEHGRPKIKYLTQNCYSMIAGDSLQGEIILNNTKQRLEQIADINNAQIYQIADILSEEYKKILQKNIETEVLGRLGLSLSSISTLPSWMGINILSDVKNFYFNPEFLIFGLQRIGETQSTAHLYKIGAEGKIDSYDFIGFASIGSGEDLAYNELTKYVYRPEQSLAETIYRVFAAKKVAERVQGVGKYTDLGVLHFDEKANPQVWIANSNEEFMKILEDSYDKQITSERELLVKAMEEIHKTLFEKKEGA